MEQSQMCKNSEINSTSFNFTNSYNIHNVNIHNDNINNIEVKTYVPIDIDDITNILVDKLNNFKQINESLIEELCMGLKLYCQNHNKMIQDWYDEQYEYNLQLLKNNNQKYLKLVSDYESASYLIIKKI